jgi:two-component system sensor histidine kinase PilS (NtrC family)
MQETCKVDEDKRLLEIINHQTLRMNKIVENIQSLSRKQSSPRQEIELAPWLTKWCDHVNPHYEHQLKLHIDTPNAVVNFDPSQLQQVIDNLCQNALRYTVQQADGHGILLHLQYVERLQRYSLAVIDYGEPVPNEQVAHLFEPFFTTDKKGTGLGLYICRELCLSNQAALDYRCGGRRRKSFSILFAKF